MIVLHAGINADRLFLWGETSDPPEKTKAPVSASEDHADNKRQYAYDVGSKGLIGIIKELPLFRTSLKSSR